MYPKAGKRGDSNTKRGHPICHSNGGQLNKLHNRRPISPPQIMARFPITIKAWAEPLLFCETDIRMASQRAHDVIIMSSLRRNDVATSFRRNNNVIFTLRVCWDVWNYATACHLYWGLVKIDVMFPDIFKCINFVERKLRFKFYWLSNWYKIMTLSIA